MRIGDIESPFDNLIVELHASARRVMAGEAYYFACVHAGTIDILHHHVDEGTIESEARLEQEMELATQRLEPIFRAVAEDVMAYQRSFHTITSECAACGVTWRSMLGQHPSVSAIAEELSPFLVVKSDDELRRVLGERCQVETARDD